MSPFAQTVDSWHDFYIMVGTAAATLIGLLFVALSINIEAFRKANLDILRVLAAQTFYHFFYILLIAVFYLIPGQDPAGLGIPILTLGFFGLLSTLIQFNRSRKQKYQLGRRTFSRRYFIPIISLVAVVIIGVTILFGKTYGFYWLVPAMILMLVSSSQNAWDLMIEMRTEK